MDSIMHTAHGVLIAKGIEVLMKSQGAIEAGDVFTSMSICGALAGALPDALGFIGNRFLDDEWKLYRNAHFGKLSTILRWLPPYGLHLWLDTFSHGAGKRWWVWNERLWLEVACWGITIAIPLLLL